MVTTIKASVKLRLPNGLYIKGMKMKVFYWLPYSIALRTLLLSSNEIRCLFNLHGINYK